MNSTHLAVYAQHGINTLQREDPFLYKLLEEEHHLQDSTLAMVAASSVADPSVAACEGTVLGNVTAEGYPGARFHAGCGVVDEIEKLAVRRATRLFGARYANVQPHSGSAANHAVMFGLLNPGDVILGMELTAGGHLTHGSRASVSGRAFQAVGYGTDSADRIDYGEVARLARENRPRLIICGASAYPRTIDFTAFREIADEVGAYLLADISHIAGLVAAGLHPSPIDHAHVTTTSTYKQLYGPRGGMILSGRDANAEVGASGKSLADALQAAVFPALQGTPRLNTIAAKARALGWLETPGFRSLAERIVANADALADELTGMGYRLLTGGTDNHMVLVDVSPFGITGIMAEQALEACGIIVNRNKIPNDPHGPMVTSGLRFGTNILAARGMDDTSTRRAAHLVDRIVRAIQPSGTCEWKIDIGVLSGARAAVAALCEEFPLRQLQVKPSERS